MVEDLRGHPTAPRRPGQGPAGGGRSPILICTISLELTGKIVSGAASYSGRSAIENLVVTYDGARPCSTLSIGCPSPLAVLFQAPIVGSSNGSTLSGECGNTGTSGTIEDLVTETTYLRLKLVCSLVGSNTNDEFLGVYTN